MLGVRISALRRDAGMSQAELAKRLRVSASTIGMYEQGRREPCAARLVALSEIFSVTTDYLLTGVPVTRQDEGRFIRIYRQSLATAKSRNALRRAFTDQEVSMLVSALLVDSALGTENGEKEAL